MDWREIANYPGCYVSSFGQVIGVDGKQRKAQVNKKGYVNVSLFNKTVDVHRLVANAFVANPFNKPQVNHKNGIKWDNRAENLEWVTPSENCKHAIANGLVPTNKSRGYYRLTPEAVRDIRSKGLTNREYCNKYNCKPTTISTIQNNLNRYRYVK